MAFFLLGIHSLDVSVCDVTWRETLVVLNVKCYALTHCPPLHCGNAFVVDWLGHINSHARWLRCNSFSHTLTQSHAQRYGCDRELEMHACSYVCIGVVSLMFLVGWLVGWWRFCRVGRIAIQYLVHTACGDSRCRFDDKFSRIGYILKYSSDLSVCLCACIREKGVLLYVVVKDWMIESLGTRVGRVRYQEIEVWVRVWEYLPTRSCTVWLYEGWREA